MLRRRHAIAVALAALCLGAPSAASASDCAGADTVPAADNVAAINQVILCLLNEQRAAAGLSALVEDPALDEASAAYSQRMVTESFFAHESPDGGVLVERLKTAGYLNGGEDWVVGENIGWGQGPLSTPRSMVNAWMNSPGHRSNILSGDYREIGLGLALGTPSDTTWGATYTTDFGTNVDEGTVAFAASRSPAPRKPAKKAKARKAGCARAAKAHAASAGKGKAKAKGKKAKARRTCARRATARR